MADWVEGLHPRAPAGSATGGQFVTKGGAGVRRTGGWALDAGDREEIAKYRERLDINPPEPNYTDFTGQESKAVAAYAGHFDSIVINHRLRNHDDNLLDYDQRQTVYGLESVMTKAKLPENMLLHRWVSSDFSSVLNELEPGDRIEDRGFISTSFTERGPSIAATPQGHSVMKILAPAGSRALIVPEQVITSMIENEVILDRDSALEYIGEDPDDGSRYFKLVQPKAKPKVSDQTGEVAYGADEDVDGNKIWWHGSASGDLRGGTSGLHLGTFEAATVALEARIGIPADGKGWRGDREYGETRLAGSDSILSGKFGKYRNTGFNAGGPDYEIPKEDFYAKDYFKQHPDQQPTYPDGSKMPLTVKPSVMPFRLVGEMTNTPERPHSDERANALMHGQIKKGGGKRGYFYKNISEDEGSISIVVPSSKHIEPVSVQSEPQIHDQISEPGWQEQELPMDLPPQPVPVKAGENVFTERWGRPVSVIREKDAEHIAPGTQTWMQKTGTIAQLDEQAAAATVALGGAKREYGVIVAQSGPEANSDEGTRVAVVMGKEHQVEFPDDLELLLRESPDTHYTMFHNHPRSVALSMNDLMWLESQKQFDSIREDDTTGGWSQATLIDRGSLDEFMSNATKYLQQLESRARNDPDTPIGRVRNYMNERYFKQPGTITESERRRVPQMMLQHIQHVGLAAAGVIKYDYKLSDWQQRWINQYSKEFSDAQDIAIEEAKKVRWRHVSAEIGAQARELMGT